MWHAYVCNSAAYSAWPSPALPPGGTSRGHTLQAAATVTCRPCNCSPNSARQLLCQREGASSSTSASSREMKSGDEGLAVRSSKQLPRSRHPLRTAGPWAASTRQHQAAAAVAATQACQKCKHLKYQLCAAVIELHCVSKEMLLTANFISVAVALLQSSANDCKRGSNTPGHQQHTII